MCGITVINNIQRAKSLGYFIEMHYVGLDSAQLAKQRIHERVKSGGHGIPEDTVERRYEESFKNLEKVISNCDLIALYDNTEQFRRFGIMKPGEIILLSKNVPQWYKDRF